MAAREPASPPNMPRSVIGRAGRGQPKKRGIMSLPKASESISISLPSWLLEILDYYSATNPLEPNRSQVIQRALRRYLLAESDSPAVWQKLYDMKSQ